MKPTKSKPKKRRPRLKSTDQVEVVGAHHNGEIGIVQGSPIGGLWAVALVGGVEYFPRHELQAVAEGSHMTIDIPRKMWQQWKPTPPSLTKTFGKKHYHIETWLEESPEARDGIKFEGGYPSKEEAIEHLNRFLQEMGFDPISPERIKVDK